MARNGGSEVGPDTHGFATKIYSQCGNDDLVYNHLPSFFIKDGADFSYLIHSVKFGADKGFLNGASTLRCLCFSGKEIFPQATLHIHRLRLLYSTYRRYFPANESPL